VDLVDQIVRLLDVRLLDPLEVLLEGDDAVDALRRIVTLRARRWADTLRHGSDGEATLAAARLIATLYPSDRAFDPPPEWWATPLGQVIAVRAGHPWAESVSYATAGAMLGITRQGVHDLVRRGRLPRHPDGGVPSTAIRDRLRGAPMINDRLIDAGDLKIATRDFGGDQPPLLLLHGAGGNLAQLTTLARALRPHHRVITLDLRGHGRSGEGTWTWEAALADLSAVCVELEPETPGVVSLDGNPPPTRPEHLPGLDPQKAAAELARLHEIFDRMEALGGQVIPADQLPDLVERQQAAARDMGANEKMWIEGFRRNLVHENGETSTRPSAAATSQLRKLMNELDLGPVYAATTCPELLVLPTRDLPQEEPFADLYAAHRRFVLEQAQAAGHPRYVQLADASHAMVIEQPAVLAGLITDFLTANR
jgi:pimeloyl-ACP methyl ester carboxylesterase